MVIRTDVISIELIYSYEYTGSSEPEGPGQERTQEWELAFMHVVGEDAVELSHPKCSRFSQRLLFCLLPEEMGAQHRTEMTSEPTHPDMRMNDQAEGEDAVKDGIRARAGRSRSANHGNETCAEQPFECPVVRAMRSGRFRELGGVVDRTLEDRWLS